MVNASFFGYIVRIISDGCSNTGNCLKQLIHITAEEYSVFKGASPTVISESAKEPLKSGSYFGADALVCGM